MKHKRVPRTVPHCGDCEEALRGNGSVLLPYECSCGTWRYDVVEKEFVLEDKETSSTGA